MRSAAAVEEIAARTTGDRAQRRSPADHAGDARGADRGARALRRGGDDRHVVLDDPRGYGRIMRAPDGTVERVVETKAPGDATELELHIREVNTGCSPSRAARCWRARRGAAADNAQGEHYLPDVLPILREHERTVVAYELRSR